MVILLIDFSSGSDVILTVLLVFPVALVSWSNGAWWGLGLAIVASVAHLGIDLSGPHPTPFASAAINDGVALATFCILSVLIDLVVRQRAELQVSLNQKNLLLKEVHHRVKNNLQVVSSLLSLESGKVKNPEAKMVFKECRDRIHLMARLHQRLYSNGEFASVDFAEHLREMAETLVPAHTPAGCAVRFKVEAEPMNVDLDMAITLGLIANEILLNSLKHAFVGKESGNLTIELKDGAEREMTVFDDGNGLPADFDPKKRGGLGMELIRGLSRQVHGKAKIENGQPGGTRTTIYFPNPSALAAQETHKSKLIPA